MEQRLSRRVGLATLAALVCIGVGIVLGRGCETTTAHSEAAAPTTPEDVGALGTADPLLAEAWERIEGGRLPEDIVSALLASDAPAHRRARRLLEAMREPARDVEDEPDEAPASGVAPIVPPKIAAETQEGEAPPVPQEAPDAAPSTAEQAPAPKASPSPSRGRASLSGISLREHARGATLVLHASGGIVAGVANQPRSGIVRLVVESRGASAKALSARPRVTGARVTSVRAGTDTIIVTLELDPGWSLGNIERTSSGARIHLRRPS